jgi:hypothetical protein
MGTGRDPTLTRREAITTIAAGGAALVVGRAGVPGAAAPAVTLPHLQEIEP